MVTPLHRILLEIPTLLLLGPIPPPILRQADIINHRNDCRLGEGLEPLDEGWEVFGVERAGPVLVGLLVVWFDGLVLWFGGLVGLGLLGL
jgi:hypothetical protein